MNAHILDLVDAEIQRLISKGWKDYPSSKVNNLYLASEIFESKVSFPHEFYNIEMGNQEASGVWAQWRAKAIHKFLKQSEIELLWEVGSGHGTVAIPLQENGMTVIGIEPLFNGAAITAKSGVRTYVGTLESLNIPDNSIRAVGVFDVLEHLEKPEFLLTEIYRVLQPGGLLLVSVPAHQWLFSDFDDSIGHFRRYSRKLLSQSLHQSGFLETNSVLCSQYLYCLLSY